MQTEGSGQDCGWAVIQGCVANCPPLLAGIPEGSGDFPKEMPVNSSQGWGRGKWVVVREGGGLYAIFIACTMGRRFLAWNRLNLAILSTQVFQGQV